MALDRSLLGGELLLQLSQKHRRSSQETTTILILGETGEGHVNLLFGTSQTDIEKSACLAYGLGC